MFLLLSGRVVAKKNRKNVPGNLPGTFAIVCIYERLLTLDSCYAWENLTLDGLEQSTTTSRDVRYLVGQSELVDTSYRVATTNQREGTVLGSLSDSVANGT